MTVTGVIMETMTVWGRRESWLFQSIVSAAPQFIYFIWYPSKYTFLLLVGSSSDSIKSWSSWVVIGRWHPADSWRPLPARELPLACVSCNPFVNCQQYRKKRLLRHHSWSKSLSVKHGGGVCAYLVMTYCWASFIFDISSARSEFNSFWAISIYRNTNTVSIYKSKGRRTQRRQRSKQKKSSRDTSLRADMMTYSGKRRDSIPVVVTVLCWMFWAVHTRLNYLKPTFVHTKPSASLPTFHQADSCLLTRIYSSASLFSFMANDELYH